jgi:GNAT superfamily N-acetyltransferase
MGTTVTDSSAVRVRRIRPEDAENAAALSGQLGYEATADQFRERIRRLRSAQSQAVFVACLGNEDSAPIVGWIEVAVTYHLQSDPFVLIGGLVVQDGMRGLGIGKRLCEEVEAWTRAQGIRILRVTSRSTRLDAHRFYLRDGYVETKTSKVFEKLLD